MQDMMDNGPARRTAAPVQGGLFAPRQGGEEGRASCVLALLAGAVAAAAAARAARAAMLGDEAPPWEVHLGNPAPSGHRSSLSQGAPWSL